MTHNFIHSHAGGVWFRQRWRVVSVKTLHRRPFCFYLPYSDQFLNFKPRMTFNKLEKNVFWRTCLKNFIYRSNSSSVIILNYHSMNAHFIVKLIYFICNKIFIRQNRFDGIWSSQRPLASVGVIKNSQSLDTNQSFFRLLNFGR